MQTNQTKKKTWTAWHNTLHNLNKALYYVIYNIIQCTIISDIWKLNFCTTDWLPIQYMYILPVYELPS